MKTSNRTFKQRFTALFTAVTMLVSMIPFGFGTIAASATTSEPSATANLSASAEPVLSSDAVTFDDWQSMFPADSTENAGGVWMDKSVVSGADDLRGQTANAGEFLVGLSAIGSSLDLQSEAATATDTVLLLDASSSMGENRSTLNTATNEVIDKLMSLNPNNRVAVVFYSSSASVLLPLGHYEQTRANTTYNNKYITYSNSTYTVSSGLKKDGASHTGTSVRTGNGTNQQSAMIEAMNILNGVTDKSRTPIMVLMSDGEASVSNTDYMGGTSGTSISTFYRSGSTQVGVDRVTFFTMLTAAYVKNQVNAQWNNKFHIFSLCFNTDVPLARLLLNPDVYNVSTSDSSITSVQNYWNTYNNAMYVDGATVPIGNNPTLNATKSSAVNNMHYVDADGAFEATTGVGSTGLVAAFDKIYEKIVEISELEFVTHVDPVDGANLSGYVSFVDHIGSYMKVNGVRGIMMDGRLYSGENFAEAFYDANSAFGSIANPTELGNEFVRSLRTRLGLYTDDVTLEVANTRTHTLIENAYASQQLYYNNGAYSNYFGWYSDENNLCLGPWNDKTDPDGTNYTTPSVTYPGDASKIRYVNKSYLFLGSNLDYNEMYISVRVSRDIYTGEETVAFGIPAALLPIVRYKVVDNDTTGEVTMSYNAGNATPITLFYEVKPGINQDTLSLVDDAYIAENTDSQGNVRFLVSKYKDFTADVSNKIETSQVGDNTYSYFKPNYQNRKYYFTADQTDVYYEVSPGVYELYTGDSTWEEAGNDPNNYFYKEIVYKVVSGDVIAEDHFFPLNKHTLVGNNETGEYKAVQRADNSWYIPKGAIHRHMSRYAQWKFAVAPDNEDDVYGLLRYNIPFVEDTDTVEGVADTDNYIYACAVLGNNGIATVADTSTGGILLKKEYSDPNFIDDNASFTFTIEAADVSAATVYKYKLSHNNMVAEEIGELTFTSNTATISMKANEAIYIGGIPAGKVVKITENDHPQYMTDTVFVNDADTTEKIASITVADGAYDAVTFKNVIKPETVPVLINYIDEAYKNEADALTFEGKEEYLALLDGKMITESHYIDSYNSETDPPLVNYIRQTITGTIDPYTDKNYVRTDYYIVEDGTDSEKGIVINEYYAIDELDDPDNNETDGDGIPDKYQATAKFDAKENGSVGGVTTQVFTLKDENGNNAISGKIHPLVRNEEYNYNIVTTTPDEGYTFDYWTRDDGTDAVEPQTEITVNAGDVIYFWANFTPDTLDDPDDNSTDGDDIPDKYQATVIFGAKENGAVGGKTTQVFTLKDDGGNYATSGKVTPEVDGVVTVTPNKNYKFSKWTKDDGTASVVPQTEIILNAGEVVYYWANFSTKGGGGGGTPESEDGTLEITKTVKAPEDFNGSDTYTFFLYRETNGIQNVYKTLSVKVGQTNTFKLPEGIYYIEEDESAGAAGYTLKTTFDVADNKIEIKSGKTVKVAVENAYTEKDEEKEELLEKNDHYAYIIGYPDGNVRPEGNITRAEIATIFFRMLTDEARAKHYSNESGFSDVNKSDWFNIAISTLVKAEIINGEGGSYRPNDAITRAELCKIAASFYTMKEGKEANFSDISGHWAESFIKSAYEYGFIDGYPDGTFKPNQLVTRAEAMKIVNRTLERIAHKDYMLDDMIKWPDNSDKDTWFYADVQEATNSHAYDKNDEHEIWTGILPVRDWAELEVTE